MKRLFTFLFLICLLVGTLTAQNEVPNSGFETWISETQPERWATGNNLGGIVANAVTRTSTTSSGQFAARGEILESPITPGTPWLPSLWLGMISNTPAPISQNYTHLKGKFILQSAGQYQSHFQVTVNFLDENMLLTATGHTTISNDVSTFTEFEVAMDYESDNNDNDAAYIQIIIDLGPSEDDPNFSIGSYYIVDDLELVGVTTSVGQLDYNLPQEFELRQNYPNPFNPTTRITFSIPESNNVKIDIFNLLGEKVATLVDGNLAAGNYATEWKAKNYPSGIYVYTITAGNYFESRKMTLLK